MGDEYRRVLHERIHTFKVTVEIDTNKRTETETFQLDDNLDTLDAVMAAAESWAIELSRQIF